MDGLEVAHRRLRNQHLAATMLTDPVDVVGSLGAMQAQEYTLAKWSIAQRTAGVLDDSAVAQLVDAGAILRTHALRPTWHFVAARDIGWIQAITGPRVHQLNGHYYRRHGLDTEFFARTNRVITESLRGHNHLTRGELAEVLGKAGLEASGNRLAYVIMRAELDGLIANGVMRGRQHTYALVSERVPDPLRLEPDEALAELTRRYFTSHGPATVKDFSWWSSLTLAQIKRGLDLVGPALEYAELDARRYWYAPASPQQPEPSPTVHVLQGYDEYVVAYTESRPVTNLAGLVLDVPNENTLTHPIVLDSQRVGFWRRIVGRDRIVAQLSMAADLNARQWRAVEKAFARYAVFAGVPVVVQRAGVD